MSSAEEDRDCRAAVRDAVLDEEAFVRLTATGRVRGERPPWVKVVLRPVMVRGRQQVQFSYFDARKDITKNYFGELRLKKLDELLAMPFRQFHVQSTSADLYLRVTKGGKALLTRGKPSLEGRPPTLEHDRRKQYALPAEASDDFLQEIGMTGPSGRVRAPMQGKFRQINEFLRLMGRVLPTEETAGPPIEIVDCGCGNAYLTFGAHHYLNHVRGLPARVIGVDSNEEIIERCLALRDSLGWEGLDFRVGRIVEFTPERSPDLVLSLHACDTATDEAIAQGILWGSHAILAAPCCQHELHDALRASVLQPMLRHGILKERTADIVTDAFRALVLRIMGYRTDVVQFVDPEHTAKNLMVRARKELKPGDARFVGEYEQMKRFCGVVPHIEGLLGEAFGRHLSSRR